MLLRATIGAAAFNSEKQNDPVDPALSEWPAEYFGAHAWFTDWPDALQHKVLALDPSKGKDAKRGDFSAYVFSALDAAGVLHVDADLKRRTVERIVEDGVNHCVAWGPDAFVVEVNAFQELL